MENQYQSSGGYEDGREGGRGERREEPYAQHHQNSGQQYQQSPMTTSAVPPAPGSPSTTPHNNANSNASPFAFAPPPLSRPPIPMSHSEPAGNGYPYYNHQRPALAAHNSYPYASSASMGYRSYSNESAAQRNSPQPMNRTPSLSVVPSHSSMHSQASPSTATTPGPYPYQRQVSGASAPYNTSSPQRPPVYPSQPYYVPQAADMPRSLSYPSYPGPYPSPGYSHPGSSMPNLNRHSSTQGLEHGMGQLGVGSGMRPTMGYSFANRLPLVDRPFKCDECVQSFNRNHDLKRHKRIHLAVKPFGCDKCGKTFSRKDALRRHWLVKGCRGEDGATAPIVPMFPINLARPPALSPPTPPHNISPVEHSFSHSGPASGPPPPLHTLPPRQSTDNNQIIVTPDELAAQNGVRHDPIIVSQDHEPIMMDPQMSHPGSHRSSAGSLGEGYFEGVAGIKQDGTAALMETPGNNSPYSKYPVSPSSAPQFRRADQHSPTTSYVSNPARSYSPSHLGPEGKPVFAMPFAPSQQGYAYHHQQDGLLGPPPMEAQQMEKQGSSDSVDRATWQRWHRPSFPFPPPPGVNYNYEPTSSPIDAVSSGRPSYTQ